MDKLVYPLLYGSQSSVSSLIPSLILGIKTYLTPRLPQPRVRGLLGPRHLISSDVVAEAAKQRPILGLNGDTLGMDGTEVQVCPVLVYCL